MASPLAVIFGVGPNIGRSVAAKFAQQGFQVAAVTRSGGSSKLFDDVGDKSVKERIHHYKADLSIPSSATDALKTISKELGVSPSFVFVNGECVLEKSVCTCSKMKNRTLM